METKYCKKCGEFKSIDEFYPSQKVLLCKYHVNEVGRENKKKYRQNSENKNKEKLKYQERKIRLWANFLIHHAKSRNCENTLKVKDVLEIYEKQEGLCYWFKIPLRPSLISKHPQQPSIDRIDRTKGYTLDNVVLCCYAANIGRNESTVEVWSNFVNLLLKGVSSDLTEKSLISNLYDNLEKNDDRDEYVIYDEELNTTTTKNLNEYCKKHGISKNTMQSYRKKTKRKTQKGLVVLNRTKGETLEKRIYLLTSPENTEFKIYSLRDFCLKHNLNDSALQKVAKGEIKQYKGWKCKYENIVLT
jgi:hypothetical protein